MYSQAKNVQIVTALLKEHGINQMVVSPGGTNAPFVRGIQDDPFFTLYSVVDERSALYFAIGIYLATGKPVAMCCTSAQATRNYVPGLTEAFYKHVPILAITFSKHPQYTGQDYMQAPNQTSLPVDAVRKSFSLPYVSNEHDRLHCERLVNEAILEMMRVVPAPVQLNVPMLDNELDLCTDESLPSVKVIKKFSKKDMSSVHLDDKKVLIVVGENRGYDDAAIINFAKTHNAVIYVNHLSNMRNEYTVEGNLMLKRITQDIFDKDYCPDILITIGGQTGDYPLYHKLAESTINYEHWRISAGGEIVDTYDHLTRVYECEQENFFSIVKSSKNDGGYLEKWKSFTDNYNTSVDLPLSNALAAQQLSDKIPENSYVNFAILNSLRVWSLFHLKNKVNCFCNVGAFGIDGGMSTFFGQSVVTEELCYMVIGDLAFLYDMNSLSIRHIKNNVRIILVNNDGGMEFKYDVNAQTKKSIDRYIAAAGHFSNACGWATTNGFRYIPVKSKEDFMANVDCLNRSSDNTILMEIFTNEESEKTALSSIMKANDYRTFSDKVASRLKNKLKKIL